MANEQQPQAVPVLQRVTGMGVSPSGAWFAWGLITGLFLAGASVYLIRKKL